MFSFLTNWKTTAAGVLAISAALTQFIMQASPAVNWTSLSAAIGTLVTGVGLIVAKDFNVSSATTVAPAPLSTGTP